MASKRTRLTRNSHGNVSGYILHVLSDGLFPPPIYVENPFEVFAVDQKPLRKEYWKQAREEILSEFRRIRPGEFPRAFYEFEDKR
jgi:hypothetical protein